MVPFSPAKKENMIAWLAAPVRRAQLRQAPGVQLPQAAAGVRPEPDRSRASTRTRTYPSRSRCGTRVAARVIWEALLVISGRAVVLYVQPLYLLPKTAACPNSSACSFPTATTSPWRRRSKNPECHFFIGLTQGRPAEASKASATARPRRRPRSKK